MRKSIQIIRDAEGLKDLKTEWKGKNDPVTIADKNS